MSREIDQEKIDSGNLDEDEIRYLQDRGMLPEGVEPINDNLSGTRPLAEVANTGDANTAGMSVEQLEAALEKARKAQQAQPKIEDKGGIEDDDEDDYEAMNNDDRRAELHSRGLVTTGTKDELIARLRRSDSDQLLAEDSQ